MKYLCPSIICFLIAAAITFCMLLTGCSFHQSRINLTTNTSTRAEITDLFQKINPNCRVDLEDSAYVFVTLPELRQIIKDCDSDKFEYIDGIRDCDDLVAIGL